MTFKLPSSRRGFQRLLAATAAIGLVLPVVGCSTSSTLSGAGASFPAPIYQRWFQELAGKGVRQFISRTLDFGASDVPMNADEIAKVPQGVVQIPMTAGAIALAYNYPGCDLKLSQAQPDQRLWQGCEAHHGK